ncbi:MAG: undecaprenyldiphospho-muramoylpentapeptide beta-N-acetylglucosaminyltransferase [Chitinophagaceae bacterium]|nr:undecaprenyldiphospho-muramoylpentapeptide beta-N-acetylglucosaminyltransferase [Chitinophagaceae bacterium]
MSGIINISTLAVSASGKKKIIITGGGTGGHIFPAIAIGKALQVANPELEILFVGAKGKMEMEKVPQAGYNIVGITIAGFNRTSLWKNWKLPFQLLAGFNEVRQIFSRFRPSAVVGVGGYASFPVMRYAQWKGIDTYIHESNSFAGKSNIILGKKAKAIFVATKGMEKFFPAERIVISGNPVRREIENNLLPQAEAFKTFGLKEGLPIVLVMGGSLGARSINEAIAQNLSTLSDHVQLIWQTGKNNADHYATVAALYPAVYVNQFIYQMDAAYAAADIIVSRSGAMTVAEVCMAAKAAILVPFPHAAEDHQTANARYLTDQQAALLMPDKDAATELVPLIIQLAHNKHLREDLGKAAGSLAVHNTAQTIAQYILTHSYA